MCHFSSSKEKPHRPRSLSVVKQLIISPLQAKIGLRKSYKSIWPDRISNWNCPFLEWFVYKSWCEIGFVPTCAIQLHPRFKSLYGGSKSNAPIYCLWAWEKPEGYKGFLQLWLPYSFIQHTVKASTLWWTAVEDKWKSPRTMIWLYASLLRLKIDVSYAGARKILVAPVFFAEKRFLNCVVRIVK